FHIIDAAQRLWWRRYQRYWRQAGACRLPTHRFSPARGLGEAGSTPRGSEGGGVGLGRGCGVGAGVGGGQRPGRRSQPSVALAAGAARAAPRAAATIRRGRRATVRPTLTYSAGAPAP